MQNPAGEGGKKLAVLIDADNVSAAVIDAMLSKIATLGYACVKRMYGDWTIPELKAWKKVMHQHALQPIQQFAFTRGKNSTDGAMMIDAMDLMYTQRFDGFCICSSDSDFTRLAIRLREQGLAVYGFGECKTPDSFVSACTEFTYIEPSKVADELASPAESTASATEAANPAEPTASITPAPRQATAAKPRAVTAGAKRAIRDAIEEGKDKTGWCNGATLGGKVNAQAFGCKKLTNLIERYPDHFEVEWRYVSGDSGNRSMYVRNKPAIQSVETHSALH
ncbi:NYN domain-containing protein [Pseudomonas taiwanensis]|uniref:NYN domain-containing protein n=1 Tax=Pseudomonas taiwanensis TaxID=470150 RepID=UPI0028DFD136|nr:NYN domain-containing protein [Pseudomonas taiwanensis]MDT8925104.1 NYN domain-containing protein [Pseudomonas taiwanensis]